MIMGNSVVSLRKIELKAFLTILLFLLFVTAIVSFIMWKSPTPAFVGYRNYFSLILNNKQFFRALRNTIGNRLIISTILSVLLLAVRYALKHKTEISQLAWDGWIYFGLFLFTTVYLSERLRLFFGLISAIIALVWIFVVWLTDCLVQLLEKRVMLKYG